jgi:hypothetical protein
MVLFSVLPNKTTNTREGLVRDDDVLFHTPKMSARSRAIVHMIRSVKEEDEVPPENTLLWSSSPEALAEVLTAADVQILAECKSCRDLDALIEREKWYNGFALAWLLRYESDKDIICVFVFLLRLAKSLRRAKSYLGLFPTFSCFFLYFFCLGAYSLSVTLSSIDCLSVPIPADILARSNKLYEVRNIIMLFFFKLCVFFWSFSRTVVSMWRWGCALFLWFRWLRCWRCRFETQK